MVSVRTNFQCNIWQEGRFSKEMVRASGKMANFLFKLFRKLEKTDGVGMKLVGDQDWLCIFWILDITLRQTPHFFASHHLTVSYC